MVVVVHMFPWSIHSHDSVPSIPTLVVHVSWDRGPYIPVMLVLVSLFL